MTKGELQKRESESSQRYKGKEERWCSQAAANEIVIEYTDWIFMWIYMWLNILWVLWSTGICGCGICTFGDFQIIIGHSLEQPDLTLCLVSLWAGGWLRWPPKISAWIILWF